MTDNRMVNISLSHLDFRSLVRGQIITLVKRGGDEEGSTHVRLCLQDIGIDAMLHELVMAAGELEERKALEEPDQAAREQSPPPTCTWDGPDEY